MGARKSKQQVMAKQPLFIFQNSHRIVMVFLLFLMPNIAVQSG